MSENTSESVHKGLHRVVIVGGGFGGLYTARALKRARTLVTVIDKRNFHLFQPLLYQVATGALSPGDIAAPIRSVLERQRHTGVLLGEVVDFDPHRRAVILTDAEVGYESLVVAAGAVNFYFGNDEWEKHAPGLKSVEEATDMRRRILLAFEAAERESDPVRREALMTFVVVGGGPTGVELAGALAEIAGHTLRGEFRRLDPSSARIVLVEGADRVLPPYVPALSAKARQSLERLGIVIRTSTMVESIDAAGVTVKVPGGTERISARTVLWAAGVRANPLAARLAERTGAETDRGGRIIVDDTLRVPGHPAIYVIGDIAHCKDEQGNPLPGVAPVAMQQGKYVARHIKAKVGRGQIGPFRYRDRGMMATIGRSKAVADLKFVRVSGFIAWIMWLFIHLLYLVGFQNRVLVLVQWGWNYFTWNRGARLITGEDRLPGSSTRE
jgi:NADH dehydrogenase